MEEFLKNYWWIVLIIVILIASCTTLIILIIKSKKQKLKQNQNYENIILALGGKKNILQIEAKMSRLNVSLKDDTLLDSEKLKALGVVRIIKMSHKITLVVGDASQDIVKLYNQQ